MSRKFFIHFLFWIFDSLRNQRCEKQFPLKKWFVFKISGPVLYYWIELLNIPTEKFKKKIIKWKWIFGWFLFYLLFFFFFFWKTFLFPRNLKKQVQILKGNEHSYSRVLTDLRYHIKWRAGGAPSSPAFKCNKKKCVSSWVIPTATVCVDWAYLPVVGVKTKPGA